MRSRLALAALGALSAVAACGGAPDPAWVTVVRDANYEIAIDTGRVEPRRIAERGRWVPVYTIWYRTDHAAPRMHRDKPFDREVVHSVLQCGNLRFKVLSVEMSRRDGKRVAIQRTTDQDLFRQPWRQVEHGTSEEIAAVAACHYGGRAAAPVEHVRIEQP